MADVPNRVYVEASLPSGDPFDLEGHICVVGSSKADTCLTKIVTTHEGRGVTHQAFTPQKGAQYELRVRMPTLPFSSTPLLDLL